MLLKIEGVVKNRLTHSCTCFEADRRWVQHGEERRELGGGGGRGGREGERSRVRLSGRGRVGRVFSGSVAGGIAVKQQQQQQQ